MTRNVDAAEAAQLLGMKPEEVVAVDGTVVRLHDGTRFDVDLAAGTYRQLPGDDPAATAPRDDEHPAEVPETTESALEKAAGAADDPTAPDAVPEGSADAVLAWAGTDPARAAAALAAERGREKPRSTLVTALEKLAG
jgi:hypothetical protein